MISIMSTISTDKPLDIFAHRDLVTSIEDIKVVKNTIVLKDKRRVVCKVYDAGPSQQDRYTVVFKAHRCRGRLSYPYLTSNESGYYQGFCESKTVLNEESCGKQIHFDTLPDPVKSTALNYFKK